MEAEAGALIPSWVMQLIVVLTVVGSCIYVVARIEITTNHLTKSMDRLSDTVDKVQTRQEADGNRITIVETILSIIAPDHFRKRE